MKVNIGQNANSTFFIGQFGNENKMIFHLEDQRGYEVTTNGAVQCRMVLKSSQSLEWEQIKENATYLDIEDLNTKPALKENGITVKSINRGCLVIDFNTSRGGAPFREKIGSIMHVLFEVLDIRSTLQDNNASEIQVKGYVYHPKGFNEPNKETVNELCIIRHLSWTSTTTNCDIDVYVSNWMKHLLQHDFSTNVGEHIELRIRRDTTYDEILKEEKTQIIREAIKTTPLELTQLNETGNTIDLSIQCTGKIAYSHFIQEDGPIVLITKTLFSMASPFLVRLSVLLDSSILNDVENDQGLVFCLSDSLKITDAVTNGKFMQIMTTLLGGKYCSTLQNVRDLKIKAVLEDCKESHNTLLEYWKKEDKPFHEIHSFPKILDRVQSQPITTIIGGPGTGKKATARHLALLLQTDSEFEIVPVHDVSEIEQYGHPKCKQLFILDDVIGVFAFEYEKIINLERYKERILNVLGKLSKIMFTCRKTVYIEASKLKSFVLNEEYIVDLDDSINSLNAEDRKQILNNHCKQNDVSLRPDELPNVFSTVESIMYPLLCKLFSSKSKYQALQKEFFENPYICIHEEFDYLQGHKRIQYASLVLCMLCQNKITESMMKNEDSRFMKIKEKVFENCKISGRNSEISDALDDMINKFTFRTNEGYSLIHEWVYEVLAFHYGNKHQEDMLEYMSSSFVANKFINNDTSDDIGDLHIKIHEKHYNAFAERLVRDLKSFELHAVFTNEALKTQCICNAFIDELKKLSYIEIKKLFFHEKNKYDEFYRYIAGIHVGEIEWDRQRLLISDVSGGSKIRAIRWVISYGHRQLLRFLFDHVTEHQESIRRVMDFEIPRENENGFIRNLQEQRLLLTLSCYSNDVEVVKLLLKHCDVECLNGSLNCRYEHPLVAACQVGHVQVVKELIQHGASIDVMGYTTPIHTASKASHVDVVDLLIKGSADCNQSDGYGRTPIYAASVSGHVDVVNLLIKCGADCNQSDKWGSTPLHEASAAGHVDVVDLLIKCGADCNQRDEHSRTPIYAASKAGHVDVVNLLFKGGAHCNQNDKFGSTPLYEASKAGHVDVVDLLIKCGADCNQREEYGRTPIYAASAGGHVDVVNFLIKCGADCNQSDKWGSTLLHKASAAGHVDVVDLLIKCGADCNQSDNDRRTPIHKASEAGQVDVVDLLIKGGAHCNQRGDLDRTPIYAASKAGHVDVVDLLIKCGADCNQSDIWDSTPLHEASEAGHVDVVDLLIKGGADCNQREVYGRTPIYVSSKAGHVDVVDLLIKCGADCNQSDIWDSTPLHEASEAGHVDVVDLLIKGGADCNQSDKWGSTPIYAASKAGHVDVVDLLIKGGTDCNQRDEHGRTPIHQPSKAGHVDVVDLLIKCGADCNQSDKWGSTPLHEASEAGHVDVVDLLIKGGANCNQRDDHGRTPIYAASKAGHVDVVNLLIKCGADCNQNDKWGSTPLHEASAAGHVDVVDLLIKCCADCYQRDVHGRTPIYAASKAGHVDVVDLLIKCGADCNQSDKWGSTLLHEASAAGHVDVVDLLIKCGADCYQRDEHGRTPIYAASKAGHVDVVDLLIKCGADCNQSDKWGSTLLHEASAAGHVDVVDRLIKCGADPNQSDKGCRYLLHKASDASHGYGDDVLIKGGVDCNQLDISPLHASSKTPKVWLMSQDKSCVKALSEHDADINKKDISGESPLFVPLKDKPQAIADILLEHGAKSN
nr:uncharacterized protein LOC111105900 isoform X2 [Crassostrea virginica]